MTAVFITVKFEELQGIRCNATLEKGLRKYAMFLSGTSALPRYVIGLLIAAVSAVFVHGILFEPNHFSLWAYGDAQYYNAALHFAREGFSEHLFLPMIDPGNAHNLIPNNGPHGLYSHYPALSAILDGIGIKIAFLFGATEDVDILRYLQFTHLAFTMAGVACYCIAVTRMMGHVAGAAFGAFLLFSTWVTGFADSIVDQPLNILLSGVFFLLFARRHIMARSWKFTVPLALVSFLISRNTVELLPVVAVFSFVYLAVSEASQNGWRTIGPRTFFPCIFGVVIPATLGIALQLLQSFLDMGSITTFREHWGALYSDRINFGHLLYPERVFSLLRATSTTAIAALLLLYLILAGVVWWLSRYRRIALSKQPALAFGSCFALAFVSYPLLLPRQAAKMAEYSGAYVYLPCFLLGLALIVILSEAVVARSAPSSPGKMRLWVLLIGVIAANALLFLDVASAGTAILFGSHSVTKGARQYWAFQSSAPKQIGFFSRDDVRAWVKHQTGPRDIVVFPPRYQEGSPLEINALIEFYLQRHGVTVDGANGLEDLCAKLRNDEVNQRAWSSRYVFPTIRILPDGLDLHSEDVGRPLVSVNCKDPSGAPNVYKTSFPHLNDAMARVEPDVKGFVDGFEEGNGILSLGGWSIDPHGNAPSRVILLYVDDDLVDYVHPAVMRPDVTVGMADHAAGFRIEVPRQLGGKRGGAKLRLFGLNSDDRLCEIVIPPPITVKIEAYLAPK